LQSATAPFVIVMLLGLLRPLDALAAHLAPFVEASRLGANLSDVALPPSVRSDFASGLTNRILIQVSLQQSAERITHAIAAIEIKYDLWDENYRLAISVNGLEVLSRTLAKADEVIAALSTVHLPGLFATSGIADGAPLRINAEILFDPLEKARMDEVRKWVAENSGPQSESTPALGSQGQAAPPVAQGNSLFNRIFEQYAGGATVAAAWRDSAQSAGFSLREFRRAGR
jgi:hypothetical protein